MTRDGKIVLASEAGVLDFPADRIRYHGRLKPGKMLLLDLDRTASIPDNAIKARICRQKPYRHWVNHNRIELRGLLTPTEIKAEDPAVLRRKQLAFGYTEEELKLILSPMAAHGQEPIGSMGDDTSLAVLSKRPQLLFNYFKQHFAQGHDPAIDPLREELVMSLMRFSGHERNLLDEPPEHCRQLKIHHTDSYTGGYAPPSCNEASRHCHRRDRGPVPVRRRRRFTQEALDACFATAEKHIGNGATILILSDRNMDRDRSPITRTPRNFGSSSSSDPCGKTLPGFDHCRNGEAREIMPFSRCS